MPEPDPTMDRISEAIELSRRGERAAARRLFSLIWEEIGSDGDPFHRCVLAHYMADVQDDVNAELCWDRRALEAADLVTDERVGAAGIPLGVRGFYPSLHLNLGECYRRVGDLDRAREHCQRGQAAADVLGEDGYGELIRSGLARLAEQVRHAGG